MGWGCSVSVSAYNKDPSQHWGAVVQSHYRHFHWHLVATETARNHVGFLSETVSSGIATGSGGGSIWIVCVDRMKTSLDTTAGQGHVIPKIFSTLVEKTFAVFLAYTF